MPRIEHRFTRRLLLLVIATSTTATAQAKPSADSIARLMRKLQEAQTDPTAPALSFTHGVTFVPAYYGDEFAGKRGASYEFTSSVPFSLWGKTNVIRANVSAVVSGPETFTAPSVSHVITGSWSTASGLYRRWAIGGRFEAEPSTDSHGPRGVGGPELEFYAELNESAIVGISIGGLFGRTRQVLDVSPTLQLAYGPWSIGTGKALQWDFRAHRLPVAPLGLTIGFVTPIGREYFDLFVTPAYELSRDDGDAKWAIDFGVIVTPRWLSPSK